MNHAELVDRAEKWLRGTGQCGVVLTERGAGTEIPDAIGWGKHVIVIECKVSRPDFFADRVKPHRVYGMGQRRFYMTPPGLVKIHELPEKWGLLEACQRIVRKVWQAHDCVEDRHLAAELRLVLSELRRYQLHGITYPPLTPSESGADPKETP